MDANVLALAKECLRYEPETGKFYWIKKPTKYSNVQLGDEAGGANTKYNYVLISLLGTKIYAHRLAWFFITGEYPTQFIDHINGIGNDNRPENLRPVDRSGNARNQQIHRNGKLPGVYTTEGGKFYAIRRIANKNYYLGMCDTQEEAYERFLTFEVPK